MGVGDLGNAVIIILLFILINISISLSIGISHIKNNWDKYKCNPGIIPIAFIFGHDVNSTFNECIKSNQNDYMSAFMTPIFDSLKYYAEAGSKFAEIFEQMKLFSNTQDDTMGNFAELVTNKLINITTELNNIFIRISDTFAKLGSSITVLYYFIQSTIGAVKGAWSGLPGTFIKLAMSIGG